MHLKFPRFYIMVIHSGIWSEWNRTDRLRLIKNPYIRHKIAILKNTNHSITEGSLLKSSTGTVKGVFSGIKSLNDCLASKCLSISSEVICPSPWLTGKVSITTFGAGWGMLAAIECFY